jgi:putative two-component system response regulator
VALADVFDALTSERPYKPAFDVDHALGLMRDERGRHFDPDLLDSFLTLVDEIVVVPALRPPMEEAVPVGSVGAPVAGG